MLEDADENGAAQAVRVLNRSASIESASTVRAQLHREHHGEVERINLEGSVLDYFSETRLSNIALVHNSTRYLRSCISNVESYLPFVMKPPPTPEKNDEVLPPPNPDRNL